jgi:hypothetical protein
LTIESIFGNIFPYFKSLSPNKALFLTNMVPSSHNPETAAQSVTAEKALMAAVSRILRVLVRLLLRHGVSFQAFSFLAKRAYVQSAREDFVIPGRKRTTSRVAVLTGLTRKEIQKLGDSETASDQEALERYNRAARVISGWVRDADFRDASGEPRALPLEGAQISFAEIVRRYSGDMPPRAVLDELLRVGAVERAEDETVRLVTHAYVPRTSDSDKLAILGADLSDLIQTIDHNLNNSEQPRYQRKLMYDNLPAEAVEKFRELSAARAQGLMEYLDSWLSQHDRDVNPASEGKGRARAGLGIYFFEEDLDSREEE